MSRPRFQRSGLRPTVSPRLQQCQFSFDFVVPIGNGESVDKTHPDFLVQAMSPWSNLSDSGYDSRYDLFGFNYHSLYVPESLESGTGSQRGFLRLCELWFADSVDLEGTPSSLVGGAQEFGPFVTLPPIINPAVNNIKDSLMPVRTLKRTYFGLGIGITSNTLGGNDGGALQVARGSGRVRVKRRLDDQTEWFWGLYGYPNLNDVSVDVRCFVSGVAYYRLRR